MATSDPIERQPDLLVVDDNPDNLRLLTALLKRAGFRVRPVTSGRLAIAAATSQPPDLILLDVNMPDLNGVEVCEVIKATPPLADVPIIFISALTQTDHKLRAFRSGGVDYITKPFQADEVVARIRTQLTICQLQAELRAANASLTEQVRQQTRELADAHDRLRRLDDAKSDFLRLISHELRTPLHGLLGVTDLILDLPPDEVDSLRNAYEMSRTRLVQLLDDALLLASLEVDAPSSRATPIALGRLVDGLPGLLVSNARERGIDLGVALPLELTFVADDRLLARAIGAFLETALILAPPDASLAVEGLFEPPQLSIHLRCPAGQLPDGIAQAALSPFATEVPQLQGGDLGLNLPVVHRIAVLLGGSFTIAPHSDAGFCLSLCLPASK